MVLKRQWHVVVAGINSEYKQQVHEHNAVAQAAAIVACTYVAQIRYRTNNCVKKATAVYSRSVHGGSCLFCPLHSSCALLLHGTGYLDQLLLWRKGQLSRELVCNVRKELRVLHVWKWRLDESVGEMGSDSDGSVSAHCLHLLWAGPALHPGNHLKRMGSGVSACPWWHVRWKKDDEC